jgi:hypothetical protein
MGFTAIELMGVNILLGLSVMYVIQYMLNK